MTEQSLVQQSKGFSKVFENSEFGRVEVIVLCDEILFNAKDAARALDIIDVNSTIRNWDAKYKKVLTNSNLQNMHIRKLANRGETFLTEAGLYRLIFISRKPNALKFQDWVFTEVLPAIRKYGMYLTDNLLEKTLNDPDFLIRLLQEYKTERKRRKELEEKTEMLMHTGKTYTTTEIAKELGLKSARELNQLLHKLNVQYFINSTWVLYAPYSDNDYTTIKQAILDNGEVVYYRKWTQKGREFILNLFKSQKGDTTNA